MIDSHSGEYNPSSRSSSPPLPLRDEEEEEEEATLERSPFCTEAHRFSSSSWTTREARRLCFMNNSSSSSSSWLVLSMYQLNSTTHLFGSAGFGNATLVSSQRPYLLRQTFGKANA